MQTTIVDWQRFSSGLWRIPPGDIANAYSAGMFPKLKVFSEAGRLFTTGGISSGPWNFPLEADCYPLVDPESYNGSEPETLRYAHEGREGTHRNRTWRLGPKWIFAAREPVQIQWQRLLRAQYADGGLFASQRLYGQFLEAAVHPEDTPRRGAALEAERSSEDWARSRCNNFSAEQIWTVHRHQNRK